MRARLSLRGDESGAAAVELAIILPVLVVLLLGIGDVGWSMWQRIALQDAVQDGALYAAFNPTDVAGIKTRVVDAAPLELLDGAVVISCPVSTNPPTGRVVEVRATLTHDRLFVPGTRTLEASVQANVMTTTDCGSG
jgi:Flp pilus assembly protein TadG